jgi:hypothetical protein
MADNLFDDVDDILGEEGVEASADEKSFNEAELQDIMSEIEDLEKEFSSDDNSLVKSKLSPESLQSELAELNEEDFEDLDVTDAVEALESQMSVEQIETSEEIKAPVSTAPAKSTVLPFEKNQAGYMSKKNPEVTFEAQGQMTLALDFKVGQDNAKLTIDPVKGLSVAVSGVEIIIDDVSGCTVTMENGMTFTIPLSTAGKSLKKKAA